MASRSLPPREPWRGRQRWMPVSGRRRAGGGSECPLRAIAATVAAMLARSPSRRPASDVGSRRAALRAPLSPGPWTKLCRTTVCPGVLAGVSSYRQTEAGRAGSPRSSRTTQAKVAGRIASVTTQTTERKQPSGYRLRPSNRAPVRTSGTPSPNQPPYVHSGLHSPIRDTSVTKSQNRSGVMSTVSVRSTRAPVTASSMPFSLPFSRQYDERDRTIPTTRRKTTEHNGKHTDTESISATVSSGPCRLLHSIERSCARHAARPVHARYVFSQITGPCAAPSVRKRQEATYGTSRMYLCHSARDRPDPTRRHTSVAIRDASTP